MINRLHRFRRRQIKRTLVAAGLNAKCEQKRNQQATHD